MVKRHLLRIFIRWAVLMVLVAAGLLLAAGTASLPTLNGFIVVLAPSLLLMMLAIAPQIAQERGQADDKGHDIGARLALVVLFFATIGPGSPGRGSSALIQQRTRCAQRHCSGYVCCRLWISGLGDEREFILLANHSHSSRAGT